MDIMQMLSEDKRVIVLSAHDERSIVTWDRAGKLQWWRPVVRTIATDYPSGQFDPNNWEVLSTLDCTSPFDYTEARELALAWHNMGTPDVKTDYAIVKEVHHNHFGEVFMPQTCDACKE